MSVGATVNPSGMKQMQLAMKTELVDWKVLNGQGAHGKSDELMRHVASLFSLTATHCDDEQLETYDTVLMRLSDLVGEETRTFAAQKICQLENAPYNIIKRFAFDSIKVADPVLRHSPVLTDDDLIEVSEVKGTEHMISICMRKGLNSLVTDVLIRSGHGTVMIKLAANSDAQLSERGMSILKSAAANDHALAHEMDNRSSFNRPAGNAEKKNLTDDVGMDLSRLWKRIEPQIEERYYDLSGHSYLEHYRFDPSLLKIEKLFEQGFLGNGVLRQFACNDQFADLVCGISKLSGFPHQIVARMMACLHWEQVLVLFRLRSFTDEFVRDILECGPWMLCLSSAQSQAILKRYQQITKEEAMAIAGSWPETGLLLE
ncbi:DUF2336 domain-containing protein [uncultured Cohaesibacter sp.]|uniref:DUF2336 domain-containing protein n=1 Tax=uncultured Cohaesibacter sp. TaxID=1002546 RepID=UPI00293136CF|nr:DUF2336 domain-containing protein [uncultured Cohaesibacter sp.]